MPEGDEEARAVRGGGWASDAVSCRSANRASYSPWHRQNTIGFRLTLSAAADATGGDAPA